MILMSGRQCDVEWSTSEVGGDVEHLPCLSGLPVAGALETKACEMLFCEPLFLFVFLPVVMGVYLAVPARLKNLWLTIASLAFYAVGEWRFLGWLVASIVVNYWIAIGIVQLFIESNMPQHVSRFIPVELVPVCASFKHTVHSVWLPAEPHGPVPASLSAFVHA